MIECPRCAGYGGMDASVFGEHGWHPCFFCGATGFVTPAQMAAYERQEEEALAGFHSGSFPEWEDDGVWNPEDDQEQAAMADYHNEVTSTWKDSEPDYRLTGEDIPF